MSLTAATQLLKYPVTDWQLFIIRTIISSTRGLNWWQTADWGGTEVVPAHSPLDSPSLHKINIFFCLQVNLFSLKYSHSLRSSLALPDIPSDTPLCQHCIALTEDPTVGVLMLKKWLFHLFYLTKGNLHPEVWSSIFPLYELHSVPYLQQLAWTSHPPGWRYSEGSSSGHLTHSSSSSSSLLGWAEPRGSHGEMGLSTALSSKLNGK